MVYFLTKIPIWVHFGGLGMEWEMLVYFTLGIFYSRLVYFRQIWYIFRFGMLYPEKSGNPGAETS
jgi:hypothetical protein